MTDDSVNPANSWRLLGSGSQRLGETNHILLGELKANVAKPMSKESKDGTLLAVLLYGPSEPSENDGVIRRVFRMSFRSLGTFLNGIGNKLLKFGGGQQSEDEFNNHLAPNL